MAEAAYGFALICPLIMCAMLSCTPRLASADSLSGNWCVARSDASEDALQRALDYACSTGADCTPILDSGLCFLPNTIQAHASYAFNSYFQRKSMAPGSCDFAGTSTVARTDPSYGSCVYPSSLSTAGAATTTSTTANPVPSPITSSQTNPTTLTTPATPVTYDGGTYNTATFAPPPTLISMASVTAAMPLTMGLLILWSLLAFAV